LTGDARISEFAEVRLRHFPRVLPVAFVARMVSALKIGGLSGTFTIEVTMPTFELRTIIVSGNEAPSSDWRLRVLSCRIGGVTFGR